MAHPGLHYNNLCSQMHKNSCMLEKYEKRDSMMHKIEFGSIFSGTSVHCNAECSIRVAMTALLE